MSGLGRFLEFSIRTPDILDSLAFYKTLGFTELEIGDMWPHKYAVVSDGILCIGLHDREFEAAAITYVQQDLAKHARSMSDHGFQFSFMQLDEDSFNELSLTDRDGHQVTMLEARTFSRGDNSSESSCGTWLEIALPVRDTVRSARFWASVSPVLLEVREEPTTHMRFDSGGAPVGLSESIALEAPSLCFKCRDRAKLAALIERHGLDHEMYPGFEGALVALKAPEGSVLYVFEEDFLAGTYEVDETGTVSELNL